MSMKSCIRIETSKSIIKMNSTPRRLLLRRRTTRSGQNIFDDPDTENLPMIKAFYTVIFNSTFSAQVRTEFSLT